MRKKQFCVFFLVIFCSFSCQLWAQSKSHIEESLISFDDLTSALNVGSILGQPIRSGNTTVIPFARISFGLGAGGTLAVGGGMGAKTIPVGFIIIEGENVSVELFPIEEKKPSLLQQLLPMLLKALPDLMGGSFPGGSTKSPAPAPEKGEKSTENPSLESVQRQFNEEKYSEALEGIETLLAEDPDIAEYHAWKGNIMGSLAGSGNPMDMMKYGMGAMQAFDKALELDSGNVTAHFGRGMGRLMAPEGFGRDYNGALEDFKFVCGKEPSADSYYYLGQSYAGNGQKDQAAEAYKKALELNPDHKEAAKALAGLR
jgi:uncharacterized spore protein YtfJ/Tfp pilus assembly protein PilF